ncbi:glycogenin-2-like isoform X5 [Maniola hyperantus]|uniref:glycogenin-2-like isoform X5 n=1 Tax=Aphantopus hyperantus TaxID=2795564 RepID=UPI00156887EC|nr:glycogenin-2 isoform X5 [Maniola hyperantus]
MSNRAWVTLATNDSYSLGALVVAHSLRRSGSIYPAVVLITPSVTEAMRERLRAVFAEVVVVDVLDSGDAAHLALLRRPELGITFTKIHCWNLTQYEKCVFLDADTLIVQNCDELFEREELSAAPDVGWPDCFNSGVFVYRPSAETFSNLITFASERGSFDGGDQGLLNSYFSNWAQSDISKHLPFLYNVTSAAFYSYIPALKHYGQNLKIIHFIGAAKPWLQNFNWQSRSVDAPEHLREFVQLWWDLFVGQVHSQLDTTMTGVAGNLARVVPGEPLQQEAVDELTRRQGWETGNIDYMGADSFDNILAKISQTLSQPPSSEQPEPSKEVSQPEAVADPPSAPAPAELASEPESVASEPMLIETPSEKLVETPVEKEVAAPEKVELTPSEVAPIEVPKPVESGPIEKSVSEAEVLPTVEAVKPVEEAPVAGVPVPADEAPAPAEVTEAASKPEEIIPVPVEAVVASVEPATDVKEKTEPEAAEIPVVALEALKIDEAPSAAKVEATIDQAAPTPSVPEPTPTESEAAKPKEAAKLEVASDSPPLANTPSKEEIPETPAAKSEERRKPSGKLQLRPPLVADPALTPDSEAEDAAALAQSIIASELRTPTVTEPTPPALSPSVAPPPADSRLSVQEPAVPTPPVGAVSLSQIGIKSKPTTAAQIESSVKTDSAPSTPESPKPADVPKKKIVKKVIKKDKEGSSSGEAPVPPPRKKEKKPKEK